MPPLMQRMTFASWMTRVDMSQEVNRNVTDQHRASLAIMLNEARDFATGQAEFIWYVVAGTKGFGKTHVACAILNYRAEHPEAGPIGKFIEAPTLLNELRAGFNDNSYGEKLKLYQDFPLLVLDDLGAEYQKSNDQGLSWAGEQIYMLLNHRKIHELPTVITTNVPATRLDARIRDRILDRGTGACRIFEGQIPSNRTGEIVNE